MPTTQMNTRIDDDVKAQGDAAFAAAGYTPSQVVQTVWRLAAADATFPQTLFAMAGAVNQTAEQTLKDALSEEALRGANIVNGFYRKFGIPLPTEKEDLDYKSMRDEARAERWKERGLEA